MSLVEYSMADRQCFVCGFQLQHGISSQLAPFLFRSPATISLPVSFICSIHFDEECLALVNRIWYLNKNSIPTLYLGQSVDLKKLGKLQSDVECQLKQYEYAVSEFQTSKTSLSVVEIEATRLILTNDECGIPQNLTSRKRQLQFNEGDKDISTPCVSLECTTVTSFDSIVAPCVPCCSSLTKIPLRVSTRHKTRPQRYRVTDNYLIMRHARVTKARSSSTKLRKPLISAVSVNVEPVVECESLESYHVNDIDGFLIFSFANSDDLVKFCADQL